MITPVTEAQVIAALAGTMPLQGELADAVALYRAAGRAALREQTGWLQVRIRFPDWTAAERNTARFLAPCLETLRSVGVLDNWWFLRKHPDWRVRCRPGPGGPDHAARQLASVLDSLADDHTLQHWYWSRYEPEVLAFGGTKAMDTAHTLFDADSRGVLDLAARTASPPASPPPGRRELSIMLCTAMLRAAHLDPVERADVWHRVATSRPSEAATVTAEQLAAMTPALHQLLHLDTREHSPVFAPAKPLAFAARWTAAFRNAGAGLADSDRDGQLHRGLRDVLATIVRHHFNRLGLADQQQATLALAARQAEMTPYALPTASHR